MVKILEDNLRNTITKKKQKNKETYYGPWIYLVCADYPKTLLLPVAVIHVVEK